MTEKIAFPLIDARVKHRALSLDFHPVEPGRAQEIYTVLKQVLDDELLSVLFERLGDPEFIEECSACAPERYFFNQRSPSPNHTFRLDALLELAEWFSKDPGAVESFRAELAPGEDQLWVTLMRPPVHRANEASQDGES